MASKGGGIAVDAVGKQYSLTIIEVTAQKYLGCYNILMQTTGYNPEVYLYNWKVQSISEGVYQ